MEDFKKLGLSDETISTLEKKGFTKPTPIQEKTIPILLTGENDVIAKAQTGTGKTACFALPIIETIEEYSKNVQAIILAPTRELAIQVTNEIGSLIGQKDLKVLTVYGGAAIGPQMSQLKEGVDIVVGTPGRVIDLINRGRLNIKAVKFAVLDEADEMLNMGFLDDIKIILKNSNRDKRMLMFSATMPKEILNIAKKFMHNFEIVEVANKALTIDLTEQIYYNVRSSDRLEALRRVIAVNEDFYGIIFCKTKADADSLVHKMLDEKFDVAALHGDISQAQREKILVQFRKKNIKILIATDVAARGIDVNDLTHVINYSLPQSPETYVHRIGRTGRAGKKGVAITFLMPSEKSKLRQIEKVAKTQLRKCKLPDVDDILEIKKSNIEEKILQVMQTDDSDEFNQVAEDVLREHDPVKVVSAVLKISFENELNKEAYNRIRQVTNAELQDAERKGKKKRGSRGRSRGKRSNSSGGFGRRKRKNDSAPKFSMDKAKKKRKRR